MSTTMVRPTPTDPDITREGTLTRAVRVVGVQNISLIVAIAVLILVVGSRNSSFYLTSNLESIGTAVTISGLLAVVQTVMVIMGGIDLAVGSIAGLTSVTSAMIFMHAGSAVSFFGALAIGATCGVISGCLVVFGRMPPMIATLAGLMAYKGVAQLVSDGRAQGYTGSDPFYIFLSRGAILGIPILIWILVVVAGLVHVMLRYTRIGRNIYAVGGNDTAARLSGININRYILGVFALVGTVAALSGILITARTGSGQPVSGSEDLMFQSITAAALGGVALRGGKGSMGGTLLAVILLGVLLNGMSLLGVNPFWQNVAQGLILAAAVVIQQVRNGERRVGLPK